MIQDVGNEISFNKALAQFSPDLKLLFNPETKHFGVYQVKSNHFYAPEQKPWLLFEIVDEFGVSRLPTQGDIQRAYESTKSAEKLWDKGGEWYINKIEDQEAKRDQARDEALDERIRFVTRDAMAIQEHAKTPRRRK
jgi:hypothetical protein